ncbi:MAG: tRNA pseudouridine(55) synthase TruB [Clostridia bacterium]|nr:tRNA pseudouridine(55) synthase TruB [Clostridia bacterium]
MKREPKINKIGFLNIDKPSGITSSAVVNKIKWLTGQPCGHMGTLDPLASGVLPVGIGNATRLFDYFLQKKKTYLAKFQFGVTSDTLDSTGELSFGGVIPTETQIKAVIPSLIGDVMQVPPKYSAKNVDGKRGYDLARQGIDFTLPPKQVRIDGITLLKKSIENTFDFEIVCGGGTYIRSIARDMGEALGTQAIMSGLRRTKSGVFAVDDGVSFEELVEKQAHTEWIEDKIIPVESVLPFDTLVLTAKNKEKIFDGVSIETEAADGTYKYYREDGTFYGLATVKAGKAKLTTKLC